MKAVWGTARDLVGRQVGWGRALGLSEGQASHSPLGPRAFDRDPGLQAPIGASYSLCGSGAESWLGAELRDGEGDLNPRCPVTLESGEP